MNKKKNKNKPNKPNPSPIQKVVATEENVEDKPEEKTENVIKGDERVPEILSEVVTSPVVEVKASEGDTPKKPKRNRGKKKHSDKEDEIDDNLEEKVPELIKEAKVTSIVKDEQNAQAPIEIASDSASVASSTRKKKNKNKKNTDQSVEERKISEHQIQERVTKDVKIEAEGIITEVKLDTFTPAAPESAEQESKTSKKKNRKKKRNDSERSEKVEEVIVCTDAFQKLLNPKVENKDLNKEDKNETSTKGRQVMEGLINTSDTVLKKVHIDAKKEFVLEKKVVKEERIRKSESEFLETPKEIVEDDTGKNKNKNSNKSPATTKKEEEIQIKSTVEAVFEEMTPLFTGIDKPVLEIDKDQMSEDMQQKDESTKEKPIVDAQNSPTLKAKIAKPVEKKGKKSSDTQNVKIVLENVSSTKYDQPEEASQKMITDILAPKHSSEVEELKHIRLPDAEKEKNTAEIKEKIEAIPENIKGKKRKKSPKPSKNSEIRSDNKQSDINVETKPTQSRDEKIKKSTTSKEDIAITTTYESQTLTAQTVETKAEEYPDFVKLSDIDKTANKPRPVLDVAIPITFRIPIPLPMIPFEFIKNEEILDDTNPGDTSENKSEVQKTKQINVPENIMDTKRKKSPKPLKKIQTTPERTESIEKDTENFKPGDHIKDTLKEIKENTNILPDLRPIDEIEITSIKDDNFKGSACNIAPDIQYPRAQSQLLDSNNNNNNNMIIREISTAEAEKFNVPIELQVVLDTPFIKISNEIPTLVPELVPTGTRVTEIGSKINKPIGEKTDLKSKVMEVNQDMEDLRLSIERSLAELTAIEKTEEKNKQQFHKAHGKIDKVLEIATEKINETKLASTQATEGAENVRATPTENIQDTKIEYKIESADTKLVTEDQTRTDSSTPPVCPSRKEHKGKGKSKRKGKQEEQQAATSTTTTVSSNTESSTSESKDCSQNKKKEAKSGQKKEPTQEKGKQQSSSFEEDNTAKTKPQDLAPGENFFSNLEPIENFEDAMTSSADDVNKTFEVIATDSSQNNPEINVTAPIEDDEIKEKQEKVNPVSQPKNLLGHPNIPVRLNRTDYKKEKNKSPNTKQATIKIKDVVPIEIDKKSKESQTENKRKLLRDRKSIDPNESITCMTKENEEYVYKYSFRKVFLPSACHICKKDLKQARFPCNFCNLVFYCNQKHRDEDYPQHQALCFAVSTIVHLKDQKHIYADAKNVTGHNFRLLRMQMIVSCEKILKRKLVPWEQEAMLYPRICAEVTCREWCQAKLKDCEGCGQISYCSEIPDHLPKSHHRWCKSYFLYQKLVCYQQSKGRLEPKLPGKVMTELFQIPEKINEVLASMYEEKIDMNDIQYAALTQLATAPLTAAFCQQLYSNKMNSTYANGVHKKASFTIHVVGAELQFEADALNKWEVFFLHLRPDLKELRVVLISPELNPSNLPLDLLGNIKLCENCLQSKRRVVFDFQDKKTYYEFWSNGFSTPDLVCAFNPSIQRSSIYNGKDTWPSTIKCILKLKVPFVVTSYTLDELKRDLARIKECTEAEVEFNIVSEPKLNYFASVRPDRNFISDDEMPLLFKNYCFMVVCGAF